MKVYQSTAGCGYRQYAYVIPLRKSKNGKDYLCLWSNENSDTPIHREGEIVEDLEDIYVEESGIDINTLPISQTFLFKEFAKTYKPL